MTRRAWNIAFPLALAGVLPLWRSCFAGRTHLPRQYRRALWLSGESR